MILYHGGFNQYRSAHLVAVIRNCRHHRRHRRNLTATRVTLRRTIRLLSNRRVNACLTSGALLNVNRIRQRALAMRAIRVLTRALRSVSNVLRLTRFHNTRCQRLGVRRLLRFRTIADLNCVIIAQ